MKKEGIHLQFSPDARNWMIGQVHCHAFKECMRISNLAMQHRTSAGKVIQKEDVIFALSFMGIAPTCEPQCEVCKIIYGVRYPDVPMPEPVPEPMPEPVPEPMPEPIIELHEMTCDGLC